MKLLIDLGRNRNAPCSGQLLDTVREFGLLQPERNRRWRPPPKPSGQPPRVRTAGSSSQ